MEGRLFQATIRGDKEILLQLVQDDQHTLDRAMSGCAGKDNNPLHLGALYGHVDLVREMLRQKPKLARGLNSKGQSPLHLASARRHAGVVREILEAEAEACLVRDGDGRIPLHVATIKGRIEVMEELLKTDITISFVLTDSEEPILHLCAKNEQFKALKVLVDLLGDDHNFVNLKDNDGNNIFHLLSAMEQFKVIRFLAKNTRVDVNAKNAAGSMPLDVSLENENVLFGWITDWILLIAGAKTENKSPFNRIIKIVNCNLGGWFSEALLVVAVLTITVAFQAGLNPPGGVWQDTGYHNGTILLDGGRSSPPPELGHHYAGQSVMRHVDPKGYIEFLKLNDLTISSSTLVMVLLLVKCFINSWLLNVLPIIFISMSIWAMSYTYDVSVSFISSAYSSSNYLWSPSFFVFGSRFLHALEILTAFNTFL